MGRTKVFNKRRRQHRIQFLNRSIMKPSIPYTRLKTSLRSPTTSLPHGWTLLDETTENIYLYNTRLINGKCSINHTLTVKPDLAYTIEIFNHKIDHKSLQLPNYSPDQKTLMHILDTVTNLKICPGNSDPQFLDLGYTRGGEMKDKSGEYKTNIHVLVHVHVNTFNILNICVTIILQGI